MPGWAIFQSATLGQFCIGANITKQACCERVLQRSFKRLLLKRVTAAALVRENLHAVY